jgi:hypothetical protein
MANIPGTILAAMVSPGDTTATFATHEDIYGKGGLMTFTSLSSLSSIPIDRQKIGMLVYINETGEYYKVNSTGYPLTDYSVFENGDIETTTLVRTNSANWNRVSISDPLKFTFTGNSLQTQYTISGTNSSTNASYIQVFVENVRQNPYVSYTLSSDAVTFTEPPDEGAIIVILTPNIKLLDVENNQYSIPYVNAIEGKSAYQIWLDQGNLGNEQYFLNSLKGETGVDGNDGVNGNDGLSSYQIWRNEGNVGDEQEFLDSLIGESGINGIDGANNYQLWLSAGNNGTLTAFLSSIKGEQGNIGLTGDSAYNLWRSEGNTGTLTDFLSSLKGNKGDTGDTVTDTDSLTEGLVNLFFTANRVVDASPVQSVNTKTGDVVIGIDDIAGLTTTLNSKQVSGNYVELVDGLVPSIYLPGTVDEIQEYTNFESLTSTGTELSNVLYITTDNNKIYRWGETVYVEIVGSPGTTDQVPEGLNHKYYTTQKVLDDSPVKSVAGKTENVILEISDIQSLTTSLTSTNTTTSAITAKLPTGVSFGSYTNNSVIPANTPFEIIIRNMLSTRVAYNYLSPTLSVAYGSPAISTTYEVGVTVSSFTITPSYNQRDGGSLAGYAYLRNGTTLGTGSTYSTTSFQISTTNTFQVSARYNEGPIYNDNLGNPDNNNIKAGSLINTITLNTLYPYFYGKSNTQPTAASIATAIQNGTATKVLADASGTVSITYNANAEFLWFAHLGTQTTKQKWFIATLNSGDMGSGGLFNTPVPQNVTSPNGFWTNVQYKVYIGGYATSTTGALELRNS